MRKNKPSHTAFLRSVDLLSGVDGEWLATLDSLVIELEVGDDELLFRAGEPADAVYIVRTGRVTLFAAAPGESASAIEHIGAGGMLGLVGALGGSLRAVSARSATPCTLLRLSRDDLLRLLEQDSNLGLRFTLAAVSKKARNASAALELGERREVRIRVDRPVELVIGHQRPIRAHLENLSHGGICFGDVDSSRFPDESTWYTVHLAGEPILRLHGRVSWRQADRTAVAFTRQAPGHDLLIQGALRRLLRGDLVDASRRRTVRQTQVPADPTAG